MKKILLVLILLTTSQCWAQLLPQADVIKSTNVMVKFRANMSVQIKKGAFTPGMDSVVIRGNFQVDAGDVSDWQGHKFKLSPATPSDSIYSLTVSLPITVVGKAMQYKFVKNDTWEINSPTSSGNREFTVAASDMDLPVGYFNNDSIYIPKPIVKMTVNFTADMTSLIGSGIGYFDPTSDSIQVMGLDWNGQSMVSPVNRTLKANPLTPGLYSGSLTVASTFGDTAEWKFKAFPDARFVNNGWETIDNRKIAFPTKDSIITLPVLTPVISPIPPPPVRSTTTFKVNMAVQIKKKAFTPGSDSLFIRGDFQTDAGDTNGNWQGVKFRLNAPSLSDSIYSITVTFPSASNGLFYNYKLVKSTEVWETNENRVFRVTGTNQTLPTVYFNNDSIFFERPPVLLTLNFTADLSGILGTGAGHFDPAKDSILVMGLDWDMLGIIQGTPVRKMAPDPVHPGIYTAQLTVGGVHGDSTRFKFKAYPDERFVNSGWETGVDRVIWYPSKDTTWNLLVIVPSIAPIPAENTTWKEQINIKDKGTTSSQKLTFGTSPVGTNGIDASLGEAALPPVPPSGVFDARFELPITPSENSLTDIRSDTLKSATWLLRFQPGVDGYPFTLRWNTATLPTGSFFLKDNITGTVVNINMTVQDSLVITNTGINALQIVYSKQICKDVFVTSGWNMVSIPVVANDTTPSVLFPLLNSPAYSFSNGYQTATSLNPGKGYWIRYPQSATVNICGRQAGNAVPLVAGWNLIGAYANDITIAGLTTTPANIINSPFYEFSNGYIVPTILTCGKGYWVRTTQAGTLNLGTVAKAGISAQATIEKEWTKIIISDRNGKSSTLFAATKAANVASFDLPPLPPSGLFDVRYSTQRSVEILGTDAQQIQITGASYPVEIRTEGAAVKVTDAVTGKMLNTTLNNSKYIIDNPAISVLNVQLMVKPIAFELQQNYPNPFNPVTTIKFGLPEKTNVTLTIYNQIGERVTILANEAMDEGYHSINWNAMNMPSGIYFYELRTEKFTSVKKLILLK